MTEIKVATVENGLPVNPEKSLLPIQFVGDRVLIEPFDPDEYLSEASKMAKPVGYVEPYYKGRLMSIGGGEYGAEIPPHMKVGLTVLYWHQQAIDFEVNKITYHMVRVSDVFAYP
ncbi:MAG: co-chaperone GroES family protein [Chryseolinea sp.]